MQGAHRDDCPCQSSGDSGHALDSRCEAARAWQQPARFRKVCPLLVETPQGWRCGVNAESARPFWGRATLYATALGLVLYLAGTLALFAVLRVARYDVGYLSVVWPPRWHELRESQEKLYLTRAQQAFQAGNYQAASLSLEMVTRLNPRNYAASLTLASLNQAAGQPYVADHIYERLMREVPDQRRATAQIWFRSLLARAAYDKTRELAAMMLTEDPAERAAWLNALLFSCRRTGDEAFLGTIIAQQPNLPEWCTELIEIEQLLLRNQVGRALPRLTRIHRLPASAYVPYYQIDRLLRHGQAGQAMTLLHAYHSQLPPDETAFLRLRGYQAKDWTALFGPEVTALLRYEMAPRISAQFCAYLVSHPDPALFSRYYDRFAAAGLPVNAGTVSLFHATYLAARLAGDARRAEQVVERIKEYTASDSRTLRGLGEILQGRTDDPRLGRILPLVPLPTEVVYAILDRPTAVATSVK